MRSLWRRRNLRVRVLVPAAAAIAILASARPTPLSALAGLPLIVAGASLRLWATGHLEKTRELAFSGPYAHLRHPLYAGTLLIGCGFTLLAGGRVAVVALPLLLAFFWLYYFPYKLGVETERLDARHGELHRAYRRGVRALLPRWSAWCPPALAGLTPPAGRWRFERVRDNDELAVQLGCALALGVMAGRWLWSA